MNTTATAPPFASTPFILKERFTRIECPLPPHMGLWFEVRMNLSNAELQELREALSDLDEQAGEISEHHLVLAEDIDEQRNALPENDRKGRRALLREGRENQRAYRLALQPIGVLRRNLVAPHIRSWNLYEPATDGGDPIPIPPPCQDPASINELAPNVILWLVNAVITAYTGGEGFGDGSGRSGTAPEPTQTQNSGGPQILEPSSPSRTRSRTSSGRKAST